MSGAGAEGAADTDVLVVVGTDKHPFNRLMDWIESWYAGRAEQPTVVVQHGSSRVPEVPGATAFLGHAELGGAMAGARIVVSHGGPATIAEARAAGRLPIVVARDPEYGEHVDEHQMRYTARLATAGEIRLCRSAEEFHRALDEGLAAPAAFQIDQAAEQDRFAAREQAAARVGQIVEELVRTAGRRRGVR